MQQRTTGVSACRPVAVVPYLFILWVVDTGVDLSKFVRGKPKYWEGKGCNN